MRCGRAAAVENEIVSPSLQPFGQARPRRSDVDTLRLEIPNQGGGFLVGSAVLVSKPFFPSVPPIISVRREHAALFRFGLPNEVS